jgi:hypothetical protein
MTLTFFDSTTFKQVRAATALQSETHAALKEVFRKYVDLGYSPREISHLMQDEVRGMELVDVLSNAKDRLENKNAL